MKQNELTFIIFISSFILSTILSMFSPDTIFSVSDVPVKFKQNPSSGSVSGYRLHHGLKSQEFPESNISKFPCVGGNCECTGTINLNPSSSHYVAATAYDDKDRRSAFSNQILCHPVTVQVNGNGMVSPNNTFFVQNGNNVTFTGTPMNGSKLTSVTIDGVTKSVEGNIYNFNDVNKMSVVTFNFTSTLPVKPTNIHMK